MVSVKRALTDPEEEEAFPRGGGGVITALEKRKIELEAEADFANESQTSNKFKKRKSDDQPKGGRDESLLKHLKGAAKQPKFVELLKFKSVDKGTKLLGCVMDVNDRELVVGLPHGLRGHVTAEQASDVLHDLSSKGTRMPSLSSLFSLGQTVRCSVIDIEDGEHVESREPPPSVTKKASQQRKRKRLNLSLHVSHMNNGMSIESLTKDMVLPAVVKSEEDHGYSLGFGIKGVTGFMRHSAAAEKLQVGQLVDVAVQSVSKERRLVSVKLDSGAGSSSVVKEWDGVTLGSLLPGSCVNCKVKSVMGDGLTVSFLTFFTGTIDKFHTHTTLPTEDLLSRYSEGQKLRARIVFVNPVSKRVGLSLQPHLMTSSITHLPSTVSVGEVVEGSVVCRVDPGLGLLVQMRPQTGGAAAVAGYAHISEVADEQVENLSKLYKSGRKVSVRVIGWRPLEGVAVVSLRPSVLSQRFMSHSDISVGSRIEGKVVSVQEAGMGVAITNTLRSFVPFIHLGTSSTQVARKKYKTGNSVTMRVWEVDSNRKKLIATMKNKLLETKLPIITSLQDASIDMKVHGIVTGVQEYGVFVQFFGGVRGMAHASNLGLAPGQTPAECYKMGQVVKCRVMSVDVLHKRLRLCISSKPKVATVGSAGEAEVTDHAVVDVVDDEHMGGLHPGDMVTGTVTEVHTEQGEGEAVMSGHYLLSVVSPHTEGVVRGRLDVAHLCDHMGALSMWGEVVGVGTQLQGLMVLECMEGISTVRLTRKSSLICAVSSLPSSVGDVREGSIIPGYVCSVTHDSVFVRFLGNVTGRAGIAQLADTQVSNARAFYRVGQSVRAQVLSVSADKFSMTLKPSLMHSSDAEYLALLFRDMELIYQLDTSAGKTASAVDWDVDFGIGKVVEGVVHEVKEYGVVCDMAAHEDVVGLVPLGQVGSGCRPGVNVRGVCVDVSKYTGVVDISCKHKLLKAVEENSLKKKKKSKNSSPKLQVGVKVTGVVELVKDDYVVLSLPDAGHAIAFATARDFNTAAVHHFAQPEEGSVVTATVSHVPGESSGGRLLLCLPHKSSGNRGGGGGSDNSKVGTVEEVVVTAVHPLQLDVKTASGVPGRIHISQVQDTHDVDDTNPLNTFKVGDSLSAVVVGQLCTVSGHKHKVKEMCARSSVVSAAAAGTKLPKSVIDFSDITIGQQFVGFVQEVHGDHLWVTVSPAVRGRVYVLDAADDVKALQPFPKGLRVGQPVKATVLQVSAAKHAVDFTLREGVVCGSPGPFTKGDILMGIVQDKDTGDVKVKISPKLFGKVSLCDLHDMWVDNALSALQVGCFVRCRVLSVDEEGRVALTMRPSKGGQWRGSGEGDAGQGDAPDKMKVAHIQSGLQVRGYVKSVSPAGVFVALTRDVVARVKLSQLSDVYVEKPAEAFPVGQLVTGKVVNVSEGRLELSLRSGRNRIQTLDDIIEGKVYRGKVKRVERYGVFVELVGATAVGLVHVSQVAEEYVKDISKMFKPRQDVVVKAVSVDMATQRLSLSMKVDEEEKAELSEDEGGSAEEDMEEQMMELMEEEDGEEMGVAGEGYEQDGIMEEDNEGDETQQDDDEEEEDVEDGGEDEDEDEGDDEDDASMLDEAEEEVVDDVRGVGVSAGGTLDIDDDEGWEPVTLEDEEEDTRTVQPAVEDVPSKVSRKAAKRAAEQREKEIREKEMKRLEGDDAPATKADYEALVLTSPNSSYLWVKYAAHLISTGDVNAARQVLERALNVINYREASEKFNVWLAFLNLENTYGEPAEEAVMKLFQRALQYNDQKKLYMCMVDIMDRSQRDSLAKEVLKTMTKKFSVSAKVWLRHMEYLMKHADGDGARKLLDRSLTSLPKRKHIKVISHAGLLEFKVGNPERARSIFEAILRNYPKRLDLWSIYIDQEVKLSDANRIRSLFDRAVSMTLPAKKMKFFFKRYLEYETKQGDEKRVEYVKSKAQEYVEQHVDA